MHALYLIATDDAVRTAIAEQVKPALPPDMLMHEETNVPHAFAPETVAIILDAALADKKALKVLYDLQNGGAKTKIFLLSDGENELPENLAGESFTKPLRLGYLLARLQFYLQSARAQEGTLFFGPYRLEPHMRQIANTHDGAVVRLTEKETHLLEYLGRRGRPVNREELLAAVWGYDARIDTHTLETHIYRLRRKLDPDNREFSAILVENGAYRLAQS
jgi:DNA-binding response OmpR family regulator